MAPMSLRALRLFDRMLDAMAVLAAVLLFATTLLIALDVLQRNLDLGFGVPGIIEISEYALYLITFLGAPWALRLGAHVAVEIVVDSLPRRWAAAAERLAGAIGLAASLGLVYGGALATWKSFIAGRLVFKTFVFPEWWLLAPLPIAGLILAIEFALRLAGARTPTPHATEGDGLNERGAGGG